MRKIAVRPWSWVGAMAVASVTFGGAAGQEGPVAISGGVTLVGQAASDERVRAEAVGSLDLFLEAALGPVQILAYVEGNTTPFRDGVSRLVGEANTDAGTAVDRRRRGRVQVSGVELVFPTVGELRGHVGLLDATGFLDVSRIANDENLFFLGIPFVNNPTIEFADYALGAAVAGPVPGASGFTVSGVLTSSHGLADNPNVSYAQLLDLRERGKGLFGGAALRWRGERVRASLGAWTNTAEHPVLVDPQRAESNHGVYSVLGWFRGDHSLSARAGIANDRVSAARGFAGLTYVWTRRPDTIGLAVGHSWASHLQPALSDVSHAESFVRRRLVGDVFATASLQWIANSGFDGTSALVSSRVWVAGLRLSAQFP